MKTKKSLLDLIYDLKMERFTQTVMAKIKRLEDKKNAKRPKNK